MKKTESLRLNKDFRRLYSKGESFAAGYTVVYAMPNKKGFNRLGLTVSKSAGKAVVRNRLKRLMRESYRLIEDRVADGVDIVLVSRNRSIGKSQPQIRRDMEYALRKLGLLQIEQENCE